MRRPAQRGAAMLVALLVVTLVATLAAAMQWRAWTAYERERAAQFLRQSQWILLGTQDWARLILREDARSQTAGVNGQTGSATDHLGEAWAVPLQEIKLASFLSTESTSANDELLAGAQEVYLSGQIVDAQSKLNLSNLVLQGKLHAPTAQALRKLYQDLRLPSLEVTNFLPLWLATHETSTGVQAQNQAIKPTRIDDLAWLGLSSKSIETLRPYVTVLPKRSSLNINTASAQVLSAYIPNLDLSVAQAYVVARDAKGGYPDTAQLMKAIGSVQGQGQGLDGLELAVNTEYFEVSGTLRLWDWSISERSLAHRQGLDVRTLYRERIRLGNF